jgi:hypothetical protein
MPLDPYPTLAGSTCRLVPPRTGQFVTYSVSWATGRRLPTTPPMRCTIYCPVRNLIRDTLRLVLY